MEVDHPCFPIDLGVPEATRSADAQFVPAAEELSDTLDNMPANRCIGLTSEAETEVLSPSQQESVEPGMQFRPETVRAATLAARAALFVRVYGGGSG